MERCVTNENVVTATVSMMRVAGANRVTCLSSASAAV